MTVTLCVYVCVPSPADKRRGMGQLQMALGIWHGPFALQGTALRVLSKQNHTFTITMCTWPQQMVLGRGLIRHHSTKQMLLLPRIPC